MSTHYEDIETQARPRRSLLALIVLPLIWFLAGIAATAWLVTHWTGALSLLGIQPQPAAPPARSAVAAPPAAPPPSTGAATERLVIDPEIARRVGNLERQVAQIEGETRSAVGNADRAEGLLVAFAARRALDRGVGLGYIEGLLRDRFGTSQPQSVATVISAARQPVTLQMLQDELQQIGPQVAGGSPKQSWWSAVRAELGNLIIIRKSDAPSPEPQARLDTISRLIDAGQVSHALVEMSRLPGQAYAAKWIADARRYVAARNALDVIESSALLGAEGPSPAAPAPQPQPKSPLAAPGGA